MEKPTKITGCKNKNYCKHFPSYNYDKKAGVPFEITKRESKVSERPISKNS